MRRFLLFVSVFVTPFLTSIAQDIPYQVDVHIEGLGEDTIYLANYYGSKLFYNDTTVSDISGNFSFDGKSLNQCGKYAIVLPGPVFFDFMLVEEPMEFKTSLSNPSGDMEVIRSPENKVYFDYLHFLQSKRAERAPYDVILRDSTSTPLQVESTKASLRIMTEEVIEYQDELINSPENFLFGKYLGMLRENNVPEPPADEVDKDIWNYMWYRAHYWDRIDFSDPRLVRDGSLQTMIERFWEHVLPPDPDTMYVEAVKLLDRVGDNYEMFKYFLHHMTFESESSKMMCMDKVFVKLVNKYYASGNVDWLTDDQLVKIIDRAKELQYSLCGEVAHNITLPGVDGYTWYSLHDIESKYTLLVVWESTCGHCKKELPILQKLYDEWHERGLEIYAIGNDFENEPWLAYLEESDYAEWIHVSDNPQINAQDSAMALIYSGTTDLLSLNFRTTFDVFSTPKLFLLDEEKKILAKQIGAQQLAEMIYRREGLELPDYFKPEDKDE